MMEISFMNYLFNSVIALVQIDVILSKIKKNTLENFFVKHKLHKIIENIN